MLVQFLLVVEGLIRTGNENVVQIYEDEGEVSWPAYLAGNFQSPNGVISAVLGMS
jgi:hypothetical protein